MKRVVLITNQYCESKNKAGFHWLADAFWRAGWEVLFFTESISWISWLRRDARFAYPVRQQANRLRQVRERYWSYVWLTPFHPLNLRHRWLNHLSGPLLKTYGSLPLPEVEGMIAEAELLVFDSDHGLFLFDRFKKLNPRARCVYRVSDDLPTMRQHPVLLETELRLQNEFDLVSVPSEFMRQRLAVSGKVELHRHGLRRDLFDRPCASPYANAGPNVLFVGRQYLDHDFLVRATRLFPDWWFHVFGPTNQLHSTPNLAIYGERSFEELIPYLRHADIGLQTLVYWPGAECFTDSLKMQQYTYCRLPIVAPAYLRTGQPHVFYYDAGHDESIRQALVAARAFDRDAIPVGNVGTWDEMIVQMAGPLAA